MSKTGLGKFGIKKQAIKFNLNSPNRSPARTPNRSLNTTPLSKLRNIIGDHDILAKRNFSPPISRNEIYPEFDHENETNKGVLLESTDFMLAKQASFDEE